MLADIASKMWSRAHHFIIKYPIIPHPLRCDRKAVAPYILRFPLVRPSSQLLQASLPHIKSEQIITRSVCPYQPLTLQERGYKTDVNYGHKPPEEDGGRRFLHLLITFLFVYTATHELVVLIDRKVCRFA